MRMWWKVLIGLTVGLPMLAYVTGSLLASNAGSPPRPDPVVIQDASRPSTGATPILRPDPAPPATPGDDDDDGDDGTPRGDLDDNGVEIVNPKPTGVDDEDEGNGDGNDDDDDRDSGGDDGDDDSRDGDD